MNQSIIVCGKKMEIGAPVILWTELEGYICPNKRGRSGCFFHDHVLNNKPTRSERAYSILNPESAYLQLADRVHQLVLHYDVCFCSSHCHEVLVNSEHGLGSHFYLDLDGTLYQTCDLYWRTNTAPADDRKGNQRSVHVEISNLSWEARSEESDFYKFQKDQYVKKDGRWQLLLPEKYRRTLRAKDFIAIPAREDGERGYFSKSVNGKIVNMWDYTEQQYQTLIKLCRGINRILPRIVLEVPPANAEGEVPLDQIDSYSDFCGVLGHAHIQSGKGDVSTKFDPGSALDWDRLRKAFSEVA